MSEKLRLNIMSLPPIGTPNRNSKTTSRKEQKFFASYTNLQVTHLTCSSTFRYKWGKNHYVHLSILEFSRSHTEISSNQSYPVWYSWTILVNHTFKFTSKGMKLHNKNQTFTIENFIYKFLLTCREYRRSFLPVHV